MLYALTLVLFQRHEMFPRRKKTTKKKIELEYAMN